MDDNKQVIPQVGNNPTADSDRVQAPVVGAGSMDSGGSQSTITTTKCDMNRNEQLFFQGLLSRGRDPFTRTSKTIRSPEKHGRSLSVSDIPTPPIQMDVVDLTHEKELKRKRPMESPEKPTKKKECNEVSTLMDFIETVTKLQINLEERIENNTKRDIKELSSRFKRIIKTFNDTEVSAWLASRRNEYISTQEREKQTQTECTKEVNHTRTIGTQTEEEMTLDKNWHDKHNFGGNISIGELHELINQDWPDEYCKRTTKEQGSILDQQTDTVILINVKKEKSRLLDDLLVRHPQLGKVINEGQKNKLYTLTLNSTLETDDGTTQETCANKRISLVGIDSEEGSIAETTIIHDAMVKVKNMAVRDGRENISVASTSINMSKKARKICEHVFYQDNQSIKFFGIPASNRRKSKSNVNQIDAITKNNKKDAEWQSLPGKKSTETLIVKLQEESYSEVVKQLQKNINIEELGVKIRSMKKTVEGNIQLTIQGGKEEQNKFADEVRKNTADRGIADFVKDMKTVYIKDLDEFIDKTEIREAIAQKYKVQEEDIKVEMPNGNKNQKWKHAFAKLPKEAAEKLIMERKLRIGWNICRVEETDSPTRCYKCNFFGHLADKCNNKIRMDNRCLNCSEEGHKKKDCNNKPVCYMCTEDKSHRAQTMNCPAYRKAVEQWRRERKRVSGSRS